MFWKIIRWGGTAAVVILVVLAVVAGSDSGSNAPATQEAAPASNSKFNF